MTFLKMPTYVWTRPQKYLQCRCERRVLLNVDDVVRPVVMTFISVSLITVPPLNQMLGKAPKSRLAQQRKRRLERQQQERTLKEEAHQTTMVSCPESGSDSSSTKYSVLMFSSVFGEVSKQGSTVKKTASPRKEDSKDSSKSSAADKATSEAPKKKITKPPSATGTAAKSTAKPVKASLAPSKQSSAATAKSGPKPKGTTETSSEKASPKSGAASKASVAPAASKKTATKGKHSADGKTEHAPSESAGDVAALKGSAEVVSSDQAAEHTEPASQGGGDALSLPVETSPEQSLLRTKTHSQSIKRSAEESGVAPAADTTDQIKQQPSAAPSSAAQAHVVGSVTSPRDSERPVDTPCSVGSTGTPMEDSWSGIHHQVSPESETGSTHTTSSDDIKPRSEDYDAGGSQDDDGSNDRGVSKCGTMRCHDFLGRSSSDTSTPEEFKMYEGGAGLRVEVRLRGREAETTSEEEGVRRRPRSWLQKDEAPVEEEHSEVEATVTVKSVPDPQLFSSEDDDEDEEATEDERSEVEVIPGQAPPPLPTEPSPHFQGIVNLAFDDDGVDQENDQPDYQSTSNFRRSILLSVDECEELGSEEGGVQTPPQQPEDVATPCDVFESDSTVTSERQNHPLFHGENSDMKHKRDAADKEENSVFLTEVQEPVQEEKEEECNHIQPSDPVADAETRDDPPQERPCHLDLRHTEQYNGGPCKNHTKASDSKKVDLHLDLNEPPLTENSAVNAAQPPAGNV